MVVVFVQLVGSPGVFKAKPLSGDRLF